MYKILVPLDGSALAEDALPVAIGAAEEVQSGGMDSELQLLRVRPTRRADIGGRGGASQEPSTVEESYLARVCEHTAHKTSAAVSYVLRSGPAIETICARARKWRADLIVMATHGRTGMSRAWLGSVADGVVRTSHVPVLLHRSTDQVAAAGDRVPQHFLVPLDGSPQAEQVLDRLLPMLHAPGAKVTLLRVERPVPLLILESTEPYVFMAPAVIDDVLTRQVLAQASQYLKRVAQRLRSQGFMHVETVTELDPHVAHAILQAAAARRVDGIAMTTRGRGATRLLLGSVADKVLRATTLPLLLLRPAARRQPLAAQPSGARRAGALVRM